MRYFFWFWYTVICRAFYIIHSRRKETRRACIFLDGIERRFNGQFHPATKRKIAVSYGIYNPMICDAFTALHGRKTNAEEKERFIHYFICSSLFDDFTDHELITEAQLASISFQPDAYKPAIFDERVFLASHRFLRDLVKDKEEYDRISHALFQAQVDSKRQYHSSLDQDAIQSITFHKGGYSVQLCRHYLNYPSNEAEYTCWYQIGKLIQLTNDLYDIYKDLQDNITTLPNRMQDAYAFEQFFIAEIKEMKGLIARLPCTAKRQKNFSLSMAGIYAFGLIAIDRLKKIQGDAARLPDLKTLPRETLIVDMEKISNLAKWFKFTYRYAGEEKEKDQRNQYRVISGSNEI